MSKGLGGAPGSPVPSLSTQRCHSALLFQAGFLQSSPAMTGERQAGGVGSPLWSQSLCGVVRGEQTELSGNGLYKFQRTPSLLIPDQSPIYQREDRNFLGPLCSIPKVHPPKLPLTSLPLNTRAPGCDLLRSDKTFFFLLRSDKNFLFFATVQGKKTSTNIHIQLTVFIFNLASINLLSNFSPKPFKG